MCVYVYTISPTVRCVCVYTCVDFLFLLLVCLSPHDSIQSKPSWQEYYVEDAINFSLYHIRKSIPKGFPALGDPRLDHQIMR